MSYCLLGVFQTHYQRTALSTHSPSQIAWIGSIQACLLILLGVFVGPVFDRGCLHSLIAAGGLLLVVGTILAGISSHYWHFILTQGIVVGFGAGCVFLPSIAVLPQWFERRRGLATGLGSSGSAIGKCCPE